MRFCAFETATEWCSVALWLDGEVRALELRAPNDHAGLALPMLERLLAGADLKAGDLQAVAFGAGPGAFTGLRIACGLAQGIAFARGLPVIGVSTLEAMAEESGATRVVACLDARMGELYHAALERNDLQWREVMPARCLRPADFVVPEGDGWIGCGNGFATYGPMGMSRVLADIHPSAAAVARLAAPRVAAGGGLDAALAAPNYVRDKVAFTQAELAAR
ncbi:MAG: tRNA (adenosine(37)-N6)-threonylcarbamoyltransferase complex dimerization subunit type 1 TsaB [Betaproteobacteria bacterium]